jgi:hypothetical protein
MRSSLGLHCLDLYDPFPNGLRQSSRMRLFINLKLVHTLLCRLAAVFPPISAAQIVTRRCWYPGLRLANGGAPLAALEFGHFSVAKLGTASIGGHGQILAIIIASFLNCSVLVTWPSYGEQVDASTSRDVVCYVIDYNIRIHNTISESGYRVFTASQAIWQLSSNAPNPSNTLVN